METPDVDRVSELMQFVDRFVDLTNQLPQALFTGFMASIFVDYCEANNVELNICVDMMKDMGHMVVNQRASSAVTPVIKTKEKEGESQ